VSELGVYSTCCVAVHFEADYCGSIWFVLLLLIVNGFYHLVSHSTFCAILVLRLGPYDDDQQIRVVM